MKLTVFFDGQFWVGVVEEKNSAQLKACKHLFGSEPSDEEVFEFVNTKMLDLMLSTSEIVQTKQTMDKKINPKRLQRLVSKELKNHGVSTKAQEALQKEKEKFKKEKQKLSKEQKEAMKKYKREIKVQKAKEKHRGK